MKARIRELMEKGKCLNFPYFTLYFRESPYFKIGFIASKKVIKPVKRNYIKRIIREFVRKNFKKGDFLFVFKREIKEAGREKISDTLNKAFEELKCQNS
ncbi:MAG TPA: ribonuclease P protein component [Firmicutes bacterium]|nr:MAG: hypothetical protein DRP67_02935 [Candidatus Omnitrophota bacterium]HDD64714.1 ribonuclease P protein component [Bacillota bacterium]